MGIEWILAKQSIWLKPAERSALLPKIPFFSFVLTFFYLFSGLRHSGNCHLRIPPSFLTGSTLLLCVFGIGSVQVEQHH